MLNEHEKRSKSSSKAKKNLSAMPDINEIFSTSLAVAMRVVGREAVSTYINSSNSKISALIADVSLPAGEFSRQYQRIENGRKQSEAGYSEESLANSHRAWEILIDLHKRSMSAPVASWVEEWPSLLFTKDNYHVNLEITKDELVYAIIDNEKKISMSGEEPLLEGHLPTKIYIELYRKFVSNINTTLSSKVSNLLDGKSDDLSTVDQ